MAKHYPNIKIACWWMSVDNFVQHELHYHHFHWNKAKNIYQNIRKWIHVMLYHLPIKSLDILYFLRKEQVRVIHMYQSQYACEYIKNHKLQLLCDKYTNLNNELITVSIDDVNEVFDFRTPHNIGDYIYDESIQNHTALGYDHCWLKENKNEEKVAVLTDEASGRRLTVSTSYPAIVCYAGCYPKDLLFNDNKKIEQYHSICLECQFIPNGINMENVDKAILKSGEEYNHFIKYSFDLLEE